MESDEFRDLDRLAQRAESAPWVDYPPTPSWYPPVTGLWAAALTLTLAELTGAALIVALALLLVAEGAFLGWYRRYRGTTPSGLPPTEMRVPAALCAVAILGLAVGLVVLAHLVATWVPVTVAFVAVVARITWYEHAHAAGAAATRARLG